MFADSTKKFSTLNLELEKIEQWCKANKLSLNIKETKYTSFHKSSSTDGITLKLPNSEWKSKF